MHQHWPIDGSYINISGAFHYPCSVLDGCRRYIVNWDLRESMEEADIEIILQAAKQKYPEARTRVISDNGPQFIAKNFKEFIQISGMTHVRTSPYSPQSNGKIERWHKSLKGECIRPGTPLSLEDARRLVQAYVGHYNNVRLNNAIGYIMPKDMLAGRQAEVHAERIEKWRRPKKQSARFIVRRPLEERRAHIHKVDKFRLATIRSERRVGRFPISRFPRTSTLTPPVIECRKGGLGFEMAYGDHGFRGARSLRCSAR